jgi:protein-S-isoprenylcysteine O-methyltransferase Ste14
MREWAAALIGLVWLSWFVLYRFVTQAASSDEQVESSWSRASYIIPMFVGTGLVVWPGWPGWLGERVLPPWPALYWAGLSLTIGGLGFSTWARAVLGANWSGTVALKVGHELVQAGPYRWIRHPMYSGVLVAMAGTALASGRVHAFAGFVIALLALWYKSRIEETWMKQAFGASYSVYARATWALFPWLY